MTSPSSATEQRRLAQPVAKKRSRLLALFVGVAWLPHVNIGDLIFSRQPLIGRERHPLSRDKSMVHHEIRRIQPLDAFTGPSRDAVA